MLSERAIKGLNIPSQSFYLNKLYNEDPYNEKTNEMGYIRLSCADNSLSSDLIFEKFRSINWQKFEENKLLHYPREGGELSTLTSAANFINKFCRKELSPLSPEELIIISGVTMASDILSQILFNSGDSVLTPAPFYYRFVNDFGERGLVNVEIVQTLTENGLLDLSVERFEEAFLKAKGKVSAILIVNPQNPDGCYFTLNQLKPIIDWALNKNLFIILDEVYNLCIYEEEQINNCCFESAVKLFKTPEELNKMIWVWSMSKVFSIPGLRAGVFYTKNKKIKEAVTKFVMFNQPNCVTQFIMRHFLDDQDWFEKVYLFENLRRLKNTRDKLLLFLENQKIPFIKPKSGFFVLTDFSKFMDEQTIEGERRLVERFIRKKVLINSGEELKAPKPGWFRIVFSSVNSSTLEKAFQRITEAISETN
uniref:Aminotransferase class I/classII large domain-containing protein n=1 Tax=Meloidogyne enterolobii TaxID=390850 RepID=A0A6V7WDT4_MELEN|nr:unnamed protein product [Meloidogyne enterolobii]